MGRDAPTASSRNSGTAAAAGVPQDCLKRRTRSASLLAGGSTISSRSRVAWGESASGPAAWKRAPVGAALDGAARSLARAVNGAAHWVKVPRLSAARSSNETAGLGAVTRRYLGKE